MKKKILILLGVLAVLSGGFVFYAANNLDGLIEAYRGDIESVASKTLGTPVKFGKIQGAIFPSTGLVIDKTNIGDEKSGQFALDNLTLRLRLLPILSKRLEIVELSLSKPTLEFKKTDKGLQLPGLSKEPSSPEAHSTSTTHESSDTKVPEVTKAPISISLDKLSITGAVVTIDDEVAKRKLTLKDLNLSSKISLEPSEALIKDVSVRGVLPGEVEFSASTEKASFNLESGELNTDPVNIIIGGEKLTLNLSYGTRNATGAIDADLQKFSFTKILPVLKEAGPDLTKLPFKFEDINSKVSLLLRVTEQELKVSDLSLLLSGSPVSGKISATKEDNNIRVPELSFSLFGGNLSAPSNLALGEATTFESAIDLRAIEVDKAMSVLAPNLPAKIFGHIDQANGPIKGEFSSRFMQALNGSISFSLSKGGIRGTNLAGAVLKAANKIPLLGDALYAYTPQHYHSVLDSPDTEFSKLSGAVSIGGGRMRSNNLQLVGALYSINISGSFGFDSSVNADATITFSKDFSEALAASKKEIGNLLSADGTLVIPLSIEGTLPKVIVVPNFEKLIEIAGKRLLKDKASQLIDNALGGKGQVLRGIGSALGF